MEYENSIKYHKVFEDSTTYRNDYRKYVNIEQEIKLLKPKETEERIKPSKPFVFHDFESLHSMKVDACIPFNLFWEKSPIVGSDPRTPQTPKVTTLNSQFH